MSFVIVLFPEARDVFIDDQPIAEHFRQLNAQLESFKDCEELAKEQCPAFQMPFEPAAEVEFHAVELAFDKVTDDLPLQRCLEGLSTSFSLPRPQVTLLRQVARRLLLTSPEFLAAMRQIAPSWKPEPAPARSAPVVRRGPLHLEDLVDVAVEIA